MTYWDGKVDVNAKWIDDEQVQSGRASDEIEFEISETVRIHSTLPLMLSCVVSQKLKSCIHFLIGC
jgi:hypothetical protein